MDVFGGLSAFTEFHRQPADDSEIAYCILASGVKFDWNFSDIAPSLVRLTPAQREIAEAFIAFFEGRMAKSELREVCERHSATRHFPETSQV